MISATWAVGIGAIAVFAVFMIMRYRIHVWKQRARWAEHQVKTWQELATNRANIANTWLQACKLINIQRDQRMNYFTFARGEKTFVIETMGLLNDDVVEWKQQAGLIDGK